jgi:hypothetical protein
MPQIALLDAPLTLVPYALGILNRRRTMSTRCQLIASACLVALVLGTAASQLPAQGPLQSIPEPLSRPMESRSDLAWRFVAKQSDSIIVTHDSISVRQVHFSVPQSPGGVRHKSPFLAWFLSFLVPGGGQGYNGQWGKAAAFFGVAVVGVFVESQETCNSFFCTGPGFWLYAASSVGSQIDAPISSAAMNRRATGEAVRLPRTTLTIATFYF